MCLARVRSLDSLLTIPDTRSMGGHGEGIMYIVEGNGVSLHKVDATLKNKIKL